MLYEENKFFQTRIIIFLFSAAIVYQNKAEIIFNAALVLKIFTCPCVILILLVVVFTQNIGGSMVKLVRHFFTHRVAALL